MSGHAHGTAAAPAGVVAPPTVSTVRLLTTLSLAGALAGLLLVVAYTLTLPAIETNRARALEAAVSEVLKGPERIETLYVVNRALAREVPAGTDARAVERVWAGYGKDGARVGFALVVGEPGFQDTVLLMIGYDPASRKLLGMKVMETKETPGLGDKIGKEPFTDQFRGAEPPLVGVKRREGTNPREVQTITGATISSRTVIRAINKGVERFGPILATAPEGKG